MEKKKEKEMEYILSAYLELLFLTVFAFPNASKTGLDCNK